MMSLLNDLQEYTDSTLPMHMPGGKRRFRSQLPYQWDVTDLAATDDLYHPTGLLKELQERISDLWHAERSFALVNGSTAGILAAVRATGGGAILAARNAHRSFYNAAELCRRNVFYICPDRYGDVFGSVDPEQIRTGLEANPSVTTVFLTSPTYEGVVSDVASIADICKSRHVTLIVDEAHGAHFGFSPLFPKSAVTLGADIVIQSLHKTLPALTQTAVLHCKAAFADDVLRELAVFQTSSPSYILLASADECVRYLQESDPFPAYEERLLRLRDSLDGLNGLHLLSGNRFFDYDPGKIVLYPDPPFTGPQCAAFLRKEANIETEYASPCCFLAMTSVCDTDDLYSAFLRASALLSKAIGDRPPESRPGPVPERVSLPEKVCEPFEARCAEENICSISESAGRVSAEYVWAYPPGIPLLLPGERIPASLPEQIDRYARAGIPLYASLQGTLAGADGRICVIPDP